MARELGVPGVALESGDHVCGFYFGEDERDALLVPYLSAGLRDGDTCLGIVDSIAPDEVLGKLGAVLDVAGCVASRQLRLWRSDETYLRGGVFSPARMVEFWEEQVGTATGEAAYGFVRVVGEMSWLSRVEPDREQVVGYETWAQGFAPHYPQALLCLYDLSRLGSGILMDLLKTHPKLLLGGLVLENPHHLSSDEFATASL